MTSLRILALLALCAPAVAKEPAADDAPADDPAATDEAPADDPVSDEAPADVPITDDMPLMPEARDELHLPADILEAWVPEDEDLAAVLALYADLVDDSLAGTPDEQVKMITEVKGPELAALDEAARAILAEKGKPVLATAFVLANAMLYYADLGYAMKPSDEMTPKQKRAVTRAIENDIRPILNPVDIEARQWLESVMSSSEEGSDWHGRAKELISRMDAAGRGVVEE